MSMHVPEESRIRSHPLMGSDPSFGNNGAFTLRHGGRELTVIASDGAGACECIFAKPLSDVGRDVLCKADVLGHRGCRGPVPPTGVAVY